jgi:predicted aspartyl protease
MRRPTEIGRFFLSLLVIIFAELIMGAAADPAPQTDDSRSSPGASLSPEKSTVSPTMPFELVSDFLVVVNGQIGNLKGLKFIVDTGATTTVIDRRVADRLRLRRRAGKVMNFDRSIFIEWADIPELRAGPIHSGAIPVMVLKLAEYSEFAKNADGIIGLDLLGRGQKLTLDYERRTLSFLIAEGGTDERILTGCFVIPSSVQGLPVYLIVDTGLQGIVLYRDRLRKRLPKMRTEGTSIEESWGHTRATRVKLPGVRFFGPELVATVFLIDGPSESELPGVDGYLGPASIHAKRVEFDFAAKVLRWY